MTPSTTTLLRVLTVAMVVTATAVARQEEPPPWPDYRGPTRDGHAAQTAARSAEETDQKPSAGVSGPPSQWGTGASAAGFAL